MKSSRLTVLYILLTTLASGITAFAQPEFETGKAAYTAKKYAEAEKALKAVSIKSSNYAAAQYILGRMAFDLKKFDAAADYFEEATERNPSVGDYFSWMGDTYAAIGADAGFFTQMSVGPKALRAWEKATQLDLTNITARVSLAGAYLQAPAFMGGGEDKAKTMGVEAQALMDEAMKKEENVIHYYWYGKISALHGLKLEKGEDSLRKYLLHQPKGDEPTLAAAHMRLGQIKERQGNKAEAKAEFALALKLDNKLDAAKEGLERTSKP